MEKKGWIPEKPKLHIQGSLYICVCVCASFDLTTSQIRIVRLLLHFSLAWCIGIGYMNKIVTDKTYAGALPQYLKYREKSPFEVGGNDWKFSTVT